jgi:O-antigen ligase
VSIDKTLPVSLKINHIASCKKGRLFDIYIIGLTPLMTFFTINDSFSMYTLLPLTMLLLARFLLLSSINKTNVVNRTLIISGAIVLWLGLTLGINSLTNSEIITTMSLIRWMYICEALLFFYLVTFKNYAKDEIVDLIRYVVFSGVIISIAIIYAWLNGRTGKVSLYSVYGTYVEENYTGSLLAIIFIVGVMKVYITKKNMLYSSIQLGIILFGMLLTGCRAAILAVIAGLLLFYLTSVRFSLKTVRTMSLMLLFIAVMLWIAYKYVPVWTWQRLFVNSYDDISNNLRLRVWLQALQGFCAHPIHGWGVGNYSTILLGENGSIVAHNSYLAILVDGGIVYFLLMFSLIFPYIKEIFLKKKPLLALLCCFFIVTFIVEAVRMAFFWYGLFLIKVMAQCPNMFEQNLHQEVTKNYNRLV